MKDILISWAFVVLVGLVIFYAAAAFIFWQPNPGDWPMFGRLATAGATLILAAGSSYLAVQAARNA